MNRLVSGRRRREKGFTLIELVLVIAILGILAVAALPSFINIVGNAETSARDGVVGAVRAGIANQRALNVAQGGAGNPPATLDPAGNAACGTANRCFTGVLQQGVEDGRWAKNGLAYTYTPTGGGAAVTFTYTAATGTFQ
ncbi:MAG: prepilin-type N-terminal cleavage/methylation domain-containing protein [Deltaproteobacteria bacterium]|nr:prepilin-type N-terminal cleavage/methylation domain-containing protein [Deltaproteobacteria bacterium]